MFDMMSLGKRRQVFFLCALLSLTLIAIMIFDNPDVYSGRRPDSDQTDEQPPEEEEVEEQEDAQEVKEQDAEKGDENLKKAGQGIVIGAVSAVGAKLANDYQRNRKNRRQPPQEQVLVAGPVTPEAVDLARKLEKKKVIPPEFKKKLTEYDHYKRQRLPDEIDQIADGLDKDARATGFKPKEPISSWKKVCHDDAVKLINDCDGTPDKGPKYRCPCGRDGNLFTDFEPGSGVYGFKHKGCTRKIFGSELIPTIEAIKIDLGVPSPITHIKCPECKKVVHRNALGRPNRAIQFVRKLFGRGMKNATCPYCKKDIVEPPKGSYSHPWQQPKYDARGLGEIMKGVYQQRKR